MRIRLILLHPTLNHVGQDLIRHVPPVRQGTLYFALAGLGSHRTQISHLTYFSFYLLTYLPTFLLTYTYLLTYLLTY